MIEYKEKYNYYCAQLNDCISKDDVKKHNHAMKCLSKLFYEVQEIQDKSFFQELMQSENERVRLLVSAHCLGMNIYVRDAERILLTIAKSNKNPFLAFEAQATLDVWRQQGYLKF